MTPIYVAFYLIFALLWAGFALLTSLEDEPHLYPLEYSIWGLLHFLFAPFFIFVVFIFCITDRYLWKIAIRNVKRLLRGEL